MNEDFPTSESAKEMMAMVAPLYDNSFVAKWLYEVQGLTLDKIKGWLEELPNQAFPETATWGMEYWEQKYGLPENPSLKLEERRQRVITWRNFSFPMNPERIRLEAENITQTLTWVEELLDEPSTCRLGVRLYENERKFDSKHLQNTIKAMKPSHITIFFYYYRKLQYEVGMKAAARYRMGNKITLSLNRMVKRFPIRSTNRVPLKRLEVNLSGTGLTTLHDYWILDGSELLDGSRILKAYKEVELL